MDQNLYNSAAAPSSFDAAVAPGLGHFQNDWSSADFLESRLLVIDDDLATLEMICKELKDTGFKRTLGISDPEEAKKHFNSADLVLLDVHLPNVDGITLLKEIRAQNDTRFLPVIILTAETEFTTRMEALSAGANDFLVKSAPTSELIHRVKNVLCFKKHADGMADRMAEVERNMITDVLSGLHNRRGFDEHFSNVFETPPKDQNIISLALLDIDNFKVTNDTYGHEIGDQTIRLIGNCLKETCGPLDFAARIGGDEFAIVSIHSDPTWPEKLAEKIQQEVFASSIPLADGKSFATTSISIGVSSIDEKIRSKGDLYRSADAALYQGKRQGRNTVNVYLDAASHSIGENHLAHIPQLADYNQETNPKDGRVLIIDDETVVSGMLELQLRRANYTDVICQNDAMRAMETIVDQQPDLIILDIHMPGINGLEILEQAKTNEATSSIPVLIMTGTNDERIRMASLKLGASDFITKPAKPAELDARVYNSLKVKLQHDQLLKFSDRLAHEIEVRTKELFATRRETILCLGRAAEARDVDTGNHVLRVGHYSAIIAQAMGKSADYVGWIELAAQLHDVGKLSIPDAILCKPARLDADERKIIETHCDLANRIFFGASPELETATITSPLLKMAARIASTHHEKWDGSGYPNQLAATEIPIEGRITAVADVFDALSSKRCYKDVIEDEECFRIILEASGTHFDPDVVEAFIKSKDKILDAKEKWADKLPNNSDRTEH